MGDFLNVMACELELPSNDSRTTDIHFLSCILLNANYVKCRGACNGGVLDIGPYTLEYGIQVAYKKLKISCLADSCLVAYIRPESLIYERDLRVLSC